LPVSYAGLILLSPFLPQAFTRVGITDPGIRGLQPDQEARAAAFLYRLATGTEEGPEFELVFIKLLLGLPLDRLLVVSPGLLLPGDVEESRSLLMAVIQHWSALKRTSIEALQSTFLQRGGLLRHQDFGWQLSVEPGPFDVLLNQLPWGIGVVRQPWSPEPIYTQWQMS
jgi:hypothetical protein